LLFLFQMEATHWFYLIVGGIYLLSRFLKKNESNESGHPQPKPPRPTASNQTPHETPRPLTFDELLKQLTEAKNIDKPVEVPRSTPQTRTVEVVDYDENLEDETFEEIVPDYQAKRNTYEEFEERNRSSFHRKSLEETLDVRNTDMQYGKFKVFEQGNQRNLLEEYTKQFQDPEGLQKAIVMSEILNRKF
jgi:hypothetical protein